mgnify:CR=1 FL=1
MWISGQGLPGGAPLLAWRPFEHAADRFSSRTWRLSSTQLTGSFCWFIVAVLLLVRSCMKRLAPAYLRVVLGGGSATAAAAVPASGDAKAAAAATGAAGANLAGPGPAGIRPQVSELLAVVSAVGWNMSGRVDCF